MRVGVLGGGQLGRMLALAGYPLGLRFRFLDPAPEAPVEELAELLTADLNELHTPSLSSNAAVSAPHLAWTTDLLERFTHELEVITYEFENVPVEAVQRLMQRVPVYPPIEALRASQDRLMEKQFFRQLGLRTAPFVPINQRADLDQGLIELGTPAILKTRRFGYDGKGQYWLKSADPGVAESAWSALGGVPLILEGVVPFTRELSHISVRGRDGSLVFYPLVENEHRGGILRKSIAPAPGVSAELQAEAQAASRAVLEGLKYVGVLTIEFFEVEGTLVANEMAPRVHNSGHWTIEACRTSQFENHLRAVLGWPLGATDPVGYSAMINLIGVLPSTSEFRALLGLPGIHPHLYGKQARPGRKLGHITVWMEKESQRTEVLVGLDELLSVADAI